MTARAKGGLASLARRSEDRRYVTAKSEKQVPPPQVAQERNLRVGMTTAGGAALSDLKVRPPKEKRKQVPRPGYLVPLRRGCKMGTWAETQPPAPVSNRQSSTPGFNRQRAAGKCRTRVWMAVQEQISAAMAPWSPARQIANRCRLRERRAGPSQKGRPCPTGPAPSRGAAMNRSW